MLTAAVHVPLCDSVGLMAISYARVNADNAMATRETTNIALGTNMEFPGEMMLYLLQ